MNNNDEKNAVFNFYDGLLKGVDDSINGTITDQEEDTELEDNQEEIDGTTYKVTNLVHISE